MIALLVVALTLALLLGVQFGLLLRLASSQPLRHSLVALHQKLDEWTRGLPLAGPGGLESLLKSDEEEGNDASGMDITSGAIRLLKRLPGQLNEGLEAAQSICSSLGLASFLLASLAFCGLLLLSGARAASEGLALSLLLTGLSCLVIWVAVSAAASRATAVGAISPAVGQALMEEFQGLQLQVGLPCLLIALGAMVGLAWVEGRPQAESRRP